MKLKDLAQLITNKTYNDLGRSIRLDGTEVKTGYAVSIQGFEWRIDNDNPLSINVQLYLEHVLDTLSQDSKLFIGTWLDHRSNSIVLDLSVNVNTLEQAQDLANLNKQDAFYDLNRKELIYVIG